ncbi:unnamed protein product [Mytilus edulis]|uniref:Uncharacterized protein n=1 Tax=Mytilus edulis TaxID=6550 RepID=A0A8S3UHQ6_MYTED|nr:unnamed protein product [Mytilus edulis]
MIKCVDLQLVDFLPGGKFYSADTEIELNRTKFAHVTNLACEHHFGDLDSSQRRRPSASMHHHSSVQLLKRNRKDMMHWIQNMPLVERSTMIKDAITGGRTLREIHMNSEKSVITEVHDEMMQPVKPKKARKKKQNENLELEGEEDYDNNLILPNIENFTMNDYVAVAYQDNWYPGCVIDIIEKPSLCQIYVALQF